MRRRTIVPFVLSLPLSLSGCASCERRVETAPTEVIVPPVPVTPPTPTTYEVHEWGLLRGNLADHVVLSGPRRVPTPIPIAKPVLYFHREGTAALRVDVEVTLASGSMVEHWPLVSGPLVSGASGPSLAWRGVEITEGHCAGTRYPTLGEPPCNTLSGADGCEAFELRTVETSDGDCLTYEGARWDHLFYRGELTSAPSFPLSITPLPNDRYRVTVDRPITGAMIRVRETSASVITTPAQGGSVELDVPSGALGPGSEVLAQALGEAGLTSEEVAAFRRAWDATLFPAPVAGTVTTTPPIATAMPMAGGLILPRSRDGILYVLSQEDAARLATLTFTPAPARVARAMVVWIDLASQRPGYEPPF